MTGHGGARRQPGVRYKGDGRPPVGPRVVIYLPAETLEKIARYFPGKSRGAAMREILDWFFDEQAQ